MPLKIPTPYPVGASRTLIIHLNAPDHAVPHIGQLRKENEDGG
jgi:hypothetical protein